MKQFCLLLFVVNALWAQDLRPWIETPLKFVVELDIAGEWFDAFDSDAKEISYTGRNFLVDGEVRFATSSSLEFSCGLCTSKTHQKTFSLDAFQESAKWIFLEDRLGDPVSASANLILTQAFSRAVRDPSLFYPGNFSVELLFSQGKEWDCDPCSGYRLFAIEGIAFSSGSPWLIAEGGVEYFIETGHLFGAKLSGQYGLGSRTLCPRHFDSYGSIQFRTVDLNCYYTLRTEDWIYYTFAIEYRAFARNAPSRMVHLEFSGQF